MMVVMTKWNGDSVWLEKEGTTLAVRCAELKDLRDCLQHQTHHNLLRKEKTIQQRLKLFRYCSLGTKARIVWGQPDKQETRDQIIAS